MFCQAYFDFQKCFYCEIEYQYEIDSIFRQVDNWHETGMCNADSFYAENSSIYK